MLFTCCFWVCLVTSKAAPCYCPWIFHGRLGTLTSQKWDEYGVPNSFRAVGSGNRGAIATPQILADQLTLTLADYAHK